MNQRLQTALVTGAANGIGRVIALHLAQRGMRVVALDRDAKGLDDLARTAAADDNTIATFTTDFTASDCDRHLYEISARHPDIDVLVNNAGVGMGVVCNDYHANPVPLWRVTPEQWDMFFAVNTRPAFILANLLTPAMIERGKGRIVSVTTSLGSMLRRGYVPYGPSKAAAEAMAANLAKDLAGSGVTSNVLIPGGITNTNLVPKDVFDTSDLIQPDIMIAPLDYLIDTPVNGMRVIAVQWDKTLPPKAAFDAASAPIGWEAIAAMPVTPGQGG